MTTTTQANAWNAYTARFFITTAARAASDGQRPARRYGYYVRCTPPAPGHSGECYSWCKTKEIAEGVLAGYLDSKRAGYWGCPCGSEKQARHCCGIPTGATL